MNTQEHILAIVEPTRDGEVTIDLAQDVVHRGGRATVVVLITQDTKTQISAFADAENLTFPDAKAIYVERIADFYTSRLGGTDAAAIVTDNPYPSQVVFNAATHSAATTVAMPQRLAARRSWKAAVARSSVPVLIAPAKAA
jgi:pyridoxine 5'-phosphate synthase PdxJ